ncbi:MAG: alpha/beta fold hydrolase [Thiohalocapsa sp.]
MTSCSEDTHAGLRLTDRLPTTGGHELFFAEFGDAETLPVLHLHGGPGSGANPGDAHLFDLKRVRLILFDQRGAGDSTPPGAIGRNNTTELLGDIERLRLHLGIDRWLLCGGSWGGTLALEYTKAHPQRVLGLVLRAPFLARDRDLDWFIGANGAAREEPDAYERLCRELGALPGEDLVARMHRLVFNPETAPAVLATACIAWSNWERTLMGLAPRPNPDHATPDRALVQRQRIHVHYCHEHFFLGKDGVLPNIDLIAGIPCRIVQGEQDRICLPKASRLLTDHCPSWRLAPVASAGHGLEHQALRESVKAAIRTLVDEHGT